MNRGLLKKLSIYSNTISLDVVPQQKHPADAYEAHTYSCIHKMRASNSFSESTDWTSIKLCTRFVWWMSELRRTTLKLPIATYYNSIKTMEVTWARLMITSPIAKCTFTGIISDTKSERTWRKGADEKLNAAAHRAPIIIIIIP